MSTANASSPDLVDAVGDKGEETPHNTTPQQQQQRQPALLEGFLASQQQPSGYGILCNDPSGLCLSATKSFLHNRDHTKKLSNLDDAVNTGVITSLTKLAHQLSASTAAPCLITLEYEESNLLIKEYDGHAMALKVPAWREPSPELETTGNSTPAVTSASNGSS
jgi:Ragulator complex protein LAMTOR5